MHIEETSFECRILRLVTVLNVFSANICVNRLKSTDGNTFEMGFMKQLTDEDFKCPGMNNVCVRVFQL